MVSQTELAQYFLFNPTYTFREKDRIMTGRTLEIGITDSIHTGNWVIITHKEIVYKNDGVYGKTNQRVQYSSLLKQKAIEYIDDLLL